MVLHTTGSDTDLDGMEHRHLTVMLVDLVGSTMLAQSLEPEDLLSTTLRYQKLVEQATAEFNGKVLQIVGDGILVVFGWPAASENNAERALRAALRIHADLAALGGPIDLSCRIGIASGVVLVGDIALGTNVQPDAIFGSTLNLAARLQALATPGETVVSGATRTLGAGQLEFEPLGTQDLAGFDHPVPAFRLAGEALDSEQPGDRTPLFGRESERADLLGIWSGVKAGGGRVVHLKGEAGVGKSRLIRELRKSVGPRAWATYYCSPFHKNTPFHPFTTQVERWCGIQNSDDTTARRNRLTDHLQDILDTSHLETLFFVLAPGPGDCGATSEEELRAKLAAILLRVYRWLSRQGPVMVVVEDLQWADPSTISILCDVAEKLTDMPVLMLITSRDPLPSALAKRVPSLGHLDLDPLDTPSATALARAASGAQLGTETTARIVARGNGIPLFIEECAAAIAASPERAADDIPTTLHDLLAQQVDAAGDMRRAAVEAAVIGGAFDATMLSHISDLTELDAENAISRLAADGMLQPMPKRGSRDRQSWRFRHELVREAAYQSLVRDRRTYLHQRAAEALAAQPETARQFEQIARHWELAGSAPRAVEAWIEAARQNLRRHANSEGVQQARNGLRLLDALPPERRDQAELNLQFLLAAAERVRIGYGAEPAIDAFSRSFELARKLDDRRTLVRAGRGLFTAAMVKGDYRSAERWGAAMVDAYDDHHTRMVGNYICGAALSPRGQFAEAAAALERAANHAKAHGDEAGNAPDVAAMVQIEAMTALVQCFQGQTEAALAGAKAAVDAAGALGQPLMLANALHWMTEIHMQLDHPDYPSVAKRLDEAVRDNGGPYYRAVAVAHLAGAAIRTGNTEHGVELLGAAWQKMRETGAEAAGVLVNTELARGYMALGQIDAGLSAVEAGLSCLASTDERNYEAELRRIQAALLLERGGSVDKVEAALRQAISVAQKQGARLYELRALNDLACIYPQNAELANRVVELQSGDLKAYGRA